MNLNLFKNWKFSLSHFEIYPSRIEDFEIVFDIRLKDHRDILDFKKYHYRLDGRLEFELEFVRSDKIRERNEPVWPHSKNLRAFVVFVSEESNAEEEIISVHVVKVKKNVYENLDLYTKLSLFFDPYLVFFENLYSERVFESFFDSERAFTIRDRRGSFDQVEISPFFDKRNYTIQEIVCLRYQLIFPFLKRSTMRVKKQLLNLFSQKKIFEIEDSNFLRLRPQYLNQIAHDREFLSFFQTERLNQELRFPFRSRTIYNSKFIFDRRLRKDLFSSSQRREKPKKLL